MGQTNEQSKRSVFTFFRSYWETVGTIPEPNQRAALYDAIFGYMFDGATPDFTQAEPLIKMAWALLSPHLKASRTRAENGRKGGAPKGSRNNPYGRNVNKPRTNQGTNQGTNQEQTKELTETNQGTNQKLSNENENENEKVKEKKTNAKKNRGEIATAARALSDEVSYFSPRSGADITPQNCRGGETNPQAEGGASDSKNGEAVAGLSTGLGVGEYLRPDGLRTYGRGTAAVPPDAPPRPCRGAAWDSRRKRWIHRGQAAEN